MCENWCVDLFPNQVQNPCFQKPLEFFFVQKIIPIVIFFFFLPNHYHHHRNFIDTHTHKMKEAEAIAQIVRKKCT